jgi:gluconokinase
MSMAASPPASDRADSRMLVLVMGVSGCGKSSVGEALAARLDLAFVEGDTLHPLANVQKMSKGIALTDVDRWPWLHEIGAILSAGKGPGVVVSCSALKRTYRESLRRAANGSLHIVFLQGSRALLESRLQQRRDHFMPAALLQTQLDTLEIPTGETGVITVDIDQPLPVICDIAFRAISQMTGNQSRTSGGYDSEA